MTESLHTKYRPKTLDDVVGQDHVVKSLRRVIKDGRQKAFIFTGPAGTGKTTISRILANHFAGGEATAANIDEIDAATHSGADAMRLKVTSALYRAIGASPVKVLILDEAHRLSSTAWDALLKPIEEPPSHVYWCLCTTNEGKIPKTIQTRCLKYELKPVKEELLLELLCKVADAEEFSTADEVLEAIAEESSGSPRQALVYLEACSSVEDAAEARRVMRSGINSKEVVDLCRFLVSGKPRTWAEAVKYVQSLDVEAESIRIAIVNYLSAVLLNSKSDKQAVGILRLLEPFLKPYQQSDKLGPLLHSIGLALELDEG